MNWTTPIPRFARSACLLFLAAHSSSVLVGSVTGISFDFHPVQGPVVQKIVELTLQPDDETIERVIARNGSLTPERVIELTRLEYEPSSPGAFPIGGMMNQLEAMGYDRSGLTALSMQQPGSRGASYSFIYGPDGQVLALGGNGPRLSNAGMRLLGQLPELRVIAIDHNVPGGPGRDSGIQWGDLWPAFDGEGFQSVPELKLAWIRIGHAFGDAGAKGLSQMRQLKHVDFVHSQVTDEGIRAFMGHPSIESFIFSPMGAPTASEAVCEVFASMPNLKRLVLAQNYFSYDNGLRHLKALSGTLEEVRFSAALVMPEDLARFKADHPDAKIVDPNMEDLAKNGFIRNRVLQKAPPEAAAYLRTFIPAE